MIWNKHLGMAVAVAGAVCTAVPASAQLQSNPRDYQGVYGATQTSESRHQSSLNLMLLGGYDDDIGSAESAIPNPSTTAESSSFGEAMADLSYRYGRDERYLRLTGMTDARAYSTLDYDVQVDGAGSVEFYSAIGRSATFRAMNATGYRNYFAVGNFSSPTQIFEPDIVQATDPSFALTEQRTWTNDSSLQVSNAWTKSQRTSANASLSLTHYPESDLDDLKTWYGTVQHSVSVGRNTSVAGGYSYQSGDYRRADGSRRNLENHGLDASLHYERRISPRRRLALGIGGGAGLMESVEELTRQPMETWRGTGNAYAAIDISRSWALRAGYQRGWDFVPGFSEPLFTDTANVSVGGFLHRRTELAIVGGYSRGTVGFSELQDYKSWTGAVQGRFAMSRNSALFVSYLYYFYDYQDPASLPENVPPRFDRQVFRAGVSFWVPLAGLFGRSGETR